MALIFPGKTQCPLCGNSLQQGDDIVSFPAFLPAGHALAIFSDAGFHRSCYENDSRHEEVSRLYQRYRAIWDSRPKDLTRLEEMEAWGREAFKNFP
jgi:hypothetical protein